MTTSIFFPSVAGLDLSLRAPGMCVLIGDPRGRIGDGLEAQSALVRYGEDVVGPERLSTICDAIWSWLRSRGLGKPGDLYVLEGYGFASQMAHSLGELGGCMRREIWESGGNILIIPPTTLKKFLTGKGSSEKNVIMKTVYKNWSFDVDDDNQCDAFGCALLGLLSQTSSEGWTAYEHELLTKKVERYAGKDQESWLGGSAPGKMGRGPRKRGAKRADLGSPVLAQNVQRTRRRRRDDSGRSGAPEDGLRTVD